MRRPMLLFVCYAFCACAAIPWPPNPSRCRQCRNDYVLDNPSCPGNTLVRVSHDGGGGAISFSAFLDEVGAHSQRTYVIEQSPLPYVVGCRQVNIGGYGAATKVSCVTIRGETDNRRDVVIVGADPAHEPDFWKSSQYGGPSPCGIGQFMQIFNAEHIVVADLTLRNFPGHMLKLDGSTDNGTPWYPRHIRFHNIELHDCGDQMIKGAGEPIGCADGVLECSYLHYTDGLFESTYETQGIDLHEAHNWIVRDNLFANIRVPKNVAQASNGAGVLMWDRTDSILVERNCFVNCNAAIKLGASWYDDECDWMTAKNNLVVYDDPGASWEATNLFEIGQDVTNGGCYHNTIWNPAQAAGGTVIYCPNDVYPFENNLYLNGSLHRCGGANNNVQVTDGSAFTDISEYDFRLSATRTVPLVPSVTNDIYGNPRNNPPSAGAYEYGTAAIKATNECAGWQQSHPDWIFCDDFETSDPLVATGRYFEYDNNDGDFVPAPGAGVGGSSGMRVKWEQAEVGAGGMKLAFGRNPNSYMNKQEIRPTEDFREIYYRMYLKMEEGWEGSPAKLSRATVFTSAGDWRQAMIAHLWSDDNRHLLIDPAGCVNNDGTVRCTTYNDFDNLDWLGNKSGITPVFDSAHDNIWFCVEHHVRLNDPGQKNGVQEFWIDGALEARRDSLDFTGSFTEYAINAVFFENYWNDGSPREQQRFFDNIVVSTQKIGCLGSSPAAPGTASPAAAHGKMRVRCAGPIGGDEITYTIENCPPAIPYCSVALYDIQGRQIDRFVIAPPSKPVTRRAAQHAAGVRFVRVQAGLITAVHRFGALK